MTPQPTVYANWWSELFFKQTFERQFVIPVPPPAWSRRGLALAEKLLYPEARLGAREVEAPVFIIGLPRSGTTMLYNLLCAHERAAYVTNSMNAYPDSILTIEALRKRLKLDVRGERYLNDSLYIEFGGPAELMTMWGQWTGRRPEDLDWESNPVSVTPEMSRRARGDFKRVLAAFPKGERLIAKNPVFQTELLAIQEMFPDARFIHIVRDGRMAANSLAKLNRLNNEQLARIDHPELTTMLSYPKIRNLASYVAEYGAESLECTARVWRDTVELVRRTIPSLNHVLEIRYEDILADPRGRIAEVLDFCGLGWPEPDNAKFAAEFAGIGVIHHRNRYAGFEVVEQVAAETLARYGY